MMENLSSHRAFVQVLPVFTSPASLQRHPYLASCSCVSPEHSSQSKPREQRSDLIALTLQGPSWSPDPGEVLPVV